jgi:hypothetical protein
LADLLVYEGLERVRKRDIHRAHGFELRCLGKIWQASSAAVVVSRTGLDQRDQVRVPGLSPSGGPAGHERGRTGVDSTLIDTTERDF